MKPVNQLQTARTAFEEEARPLLKIAKPIAVTPLKTTATTLITARDDADFWVERLEVSNVTGSGDTFTVYIVPDGGTAATGNAVAVATAIGANTAALVLENTLIAPGASIQALCGTDDAVNAWGWGYDYQGQYG